MIRKVIPLQSVPLAKFIRTLEGVLIVLANALLIVIASLGDLPWAQTAKWVVILNTVATVARTVLKCVAVSPVPASADVAGIAETIAARLSQALRSTPSAVPPESVAPAAVAGAPRGQTGATSSAPSVEETAAGADDAEDSAAWREGHYQGQSLGAPPATPWVQAPHPEQPA